VKWLWPKDKSRRPFPEKWYEQFDTLLIDESSAFKHQSSARSWSVRHLSERFEFIHNLTGTPNSNTILDIWHQVFLLDRGERLGPSFWKFRNSVCEAKQVGPLPQHIQWKDKEGAEAVVYDLIRDISIRHRLEECIDIPPNHQWNQEFELDKKTRKAYNDFLDNAVTMLESGQIITAVHASSVNQKLLQIAAGAVYLDDHSYVEISDTRAELVTDLIQQRPASVVPFIWHHQRDQLIRIAKARGITHALIDGSVSDKRRLEYVRDFQAGNIQELLVHPQSAGHGLTLTRGVATIMASPTNNAEHYKQVFHRIYRASQDHKTETIHVRARNTLDEHVYDGQLGPKLDSMALFLMLVEQAKNER
jgi:SNF2 family DNA or RNA helicase